MKTGRDMKMTNYEFVTELTALLKRKPETLTDKMAGEICIDIICALMEDESEITAFAIHHVHACLSALIIHGMATKEEVQHLIDELTTNIFEVADEFEDPSYLMEKMSKWESEKWEKKVRAAESKEEMFEIFNEIFDHLGLKKK